MKRFWPKLLLLLLPLAAYAAPETNHVDTLYPEVSDTPEIYARKLLYGFAAGQFGAATKEAWLTTFPELSATAYSANDVVGTVLTLTNAIPNKVGFLENLLIIDRDNQKPNLSILLFNTQPATGTYTDNAVLALATDHTNLIAQVDTDDASWRTLGTNAILNLVCLDRLTVGASTNLWAVVVTRSTPTYTQATNLAVKFGFLQ